MKCNPEGYCKRTYLLARYQRTVSTDCRAGGTLGNGFEQKGFTRGSQEEITFALRS